MKTLACLLVACACAGGSLSATTLVPADFTQMARESELIVRGTVVQVDGQRTGARQTIESVITLRVSDPRRREIVLNEFGDDARTGDEIRHRVHVDLDESFAEPIRQRR